MSKKKLIIIAIIVVLVAALAIVFGKDISRKISGKFEPEGSGLLINGPKELQKPAATLGKNENAGIDHALHFQYEEPASGLGMRIGTVVYTTPGIDLNAMKEQYISQMAGLGGGVLNFEPKVTDIEVDGLKGLRIDMKGNLPDNATFQMDALFFGKDAQFWQVIAVYHPDNATQATMVKELFDSVELK